MSNPCTYNRAIFRSLPYLEAEKYSKACQICQVIRHIQSPDIEQFIQAFSDIIRYILGFDAYSATLTGAKLRLKEEASPTFLNRKKCPDFGKKGRDIIHLWVGFSI